MERKTKIHAEDGKQDLVITREFDLPLALLFKAYAEPEIVEQWMGTKVLQLENKKHGGWQFETSDASGNVVFRASGVIHEFVPNQKITRTFEMENGSASATSAAAVRFGVQLEFFDFEKLTDNTSQLRMHIVCRSSALRDQLLRLPFAQGLNRAHNRLQDIVSKLN